MPTQEQLQTIAEVIMMDCFKPSMIEGMHNSVEGAEILRLIVRDNLAGASTKIVSALWSFI